MHAVLPSLMTSFKIASLGETIGTLQQDRATAIAGTLGIGAGLVPMTVTLERSDASGASAGDKRTFKYQLVNDQMFTPLIAYVAMFNTLASYERQFGCRDLRDQRARAPQGPRRSHRRGRLHRQQSDLRGVDRNRRPADGAARHRHRVDRRGSARDFGDVIGVPRSVSIERVWLDEIRPRAGKITPLKC